MTTPEVFAIGMALLFVYAVLGRASRLGGAPINMPVLRWASVTAIALLGGATVYQVAPQIAAALNPTPAVSEVAPLPSQEANALGLIGVILKGGGQPSGSEAPGGEDEPYCFDDYESGDKTGMDGTCSYAATSEENGSEAVVCGSVGFESDCALRQRHNAVASGTDSNVAEFINLDQIEVELWVEYDLEVPSNYNHRSQGGSDHHYIGWFYAVTNTLGSADRPLCNMVLQRVADDESDLEINGSFDQSVVAPISQVPGVTDAGPMVIGEWNHIQVHCDAGTLNGDDAQIRVCVNGTVIVSEDNIPNTSLTVRYWERHQLGGYSNAGYTSQTDYFYDNWTAHEEEPVNTWSAECRGAA